MRGFPDKRTGRNLQYRMEDVAAAAFAVFFTQSPSFLADQTAMTETLGNSNVRTLFGVGTIPTDNPIRDLLDAVPPQQVYPMFERVLDALYERELLQAFRASDGPLLIALDGTQYHRSASIRCAHCTVTQHRNGPIDYAHSGQSRRCWSRPVIRAWYPWSPSLSGRRMATKNRTARTLLPSVGSATTPSVIGNWMSPCSAMIGTVASPYANRRWRLD